MRRQRGSQRYRVAACRKDTLNKVTTSLVRRFDVIAAEDLHVKGMVGRGGFQPGTGGT